MPAQRLSTLNVPEYGLRLRLLEEYCLVEQVLLPRRRLVTADAGRGTRDTAPVRQLPGVTARVGLSLAGGALLCSRPERARAGRHTGAD